MMFYSQYLLDKKGPLGTIWVAAHLEKKLQKNQVTEASISAAVDTILYSKVPIALRLSGQLLLGVVRVYSKKVTYLYQDCGETLLRVKRVFHSAHVDLPSDANMAPFHAITLPETYEFDYMEFDDIGYESTRDLDTHVSSRDEITLHERPQDFKARTWLRPFDQVHGTKVTHTMFSLNEGIQRQIPNLPLHSSNCELTPLEEDVLPPLPLDGHFDFDKMDVEMSDSLHSIGCASPSSSSVSTTTVPLFEIAVEDTQTIMKEPIEPTDISNCETLRVQQDAHWSEPHFMGTEEPPTIKAMYDIDDTSKGQRTETKKYFAEEISVPEKVVASTETSLSTPPTTPKSISADKEVLASILGDVLLDMNVMSTPKTPAAEERRPRSRKRKQIFDQSIVLQDECMRKQLEYTDDTLRVRRKLPCTVMDVWKSYRVHQIEQLLSEPSIPGMSNDLQELYERVFTDQESKYSVYKQGVKRSFENIPSQLGGTSEELQENGSAKDFYMPEMKNTCDSHEAMLCDTLTNSSKMDRLDDLQMTGTGELRLETEGEVLPLETAVDSVIIQSDYSESSSAPDVDSINTAETMSTGDAHFVEVSMCDKEHDQTMTSYGFALQGLSFLEEDARSETGYNMSPKQHGVGDCRKGHSHVDTNDMSTRTWAVVQYLKTAFEKSVSHQTGSKLNLDRILRGRARKEVGRMFFEILALNTKSYIEVEQEAAYADILVSAKPKLFMANFYS
ncbi:sister chromatid cohesion 1 protein 3 isoform X3 [Cryptomeria japonica]|uniref:sister chromatid cohesion 1 protein 3 isoform X3 n=1 Tax=Cryptomeria japonica TaxID=3369 RepID=UPI0025ABBB93|nr:sister chromatid cohesion 1 protein 3 isoform X3 [Cryptomeria japonica]